MEYNKYIDHTLLKPTATENDIINLCDEAEKYGFYSVCVNPCYVHLAKNYLKNTDVKVACVIGFPLGATDTKSKMQESITAVKNGADELDMVINQGMLKQKNYKYVLDDINAVCKTGAVVKVIVETCNLTKEELIKICEIVNESNAKYIKTSTGFASAGANLDDVKLMVSLMKDGKKVKASGGIRDEKTFLDFINAGVMRIGTSSGVQIIKNLTEQKMCQK